MRPLDAESKRIIPSWPASCIRKRKAFARVGAGELFVQVQQWPGSPYFGVRVCTAHIFAYGPEEWREDLVMAKLRKLSPDEVKRSAEQSFSDPEWASVFPNLAAYMFDASYEDGSKRKTSTMTLFVSDGILKGLLKDPDNNRVLWATGESVEELLLTMDAMAASEETVWRVDRESPGQQASRIKKQ